MQQLNLPTYPFKLKLSNGETQIYDSFRRKWIVLTPEEWVRQHTAMYMVARGYPAGLIAVEKTLRLNGMIRRADLVAYTSDQEPFLLVECKAPEIEVNQKTLDQAARYNLTLGVPFLFLTNGLQHYCLEVRPSGDSRYLKELPEFPLQTSA